MRLPACFAVALCLAAMLVNPTVAQDAPGGTFKDGWNTWSDTKVGDYVQYRLAAGLTVTYELKAIAADGTLTIEIANFSAEGGELSRREIQRTADKAPVQAKAPGAEIAAQWGTTEYEMADIKLPCETVTWTGDKITGSTWFSRGVPCGGVVKSGTDGADTVWLVGFVKNGTSYALTHEEPEPQAVDFKGGGTTWSQTRPGDSATYRLIGGTSVRYELTSIDEKGHFKVVLTEFNSSGVSTKRDEINCTADNAPAVAHPRSPDGATVGWTTDTLSFAGQDLDCEICTWSDTNSAGEKYFSADVPCGGAVKLTLKSEAIAWLVSYTRDGETVSEPDPDREPLPDVLAGYGDPIAMGLPEKVRKQMQDQGTAITRMRLYFNDDAAAEDGVSLEYEGMYTEVPIIYAAFDTERCDKSLSYKDWLARDGRFVDLGFDIKTRPKTLKGMQVKIEHSHLQGETETTLSTFEISRPEPGDPWESLRLRGARPGINRYTLIVTYTDSKNQQSEQRGFSHWVIVAAPPMFEFTNQATGVATQMQAGGLTLLDAEVRLDGSFLLHHGLDAADCTLRISKRGKREFNLESLPPDVRRAIERDATPLGWQELGRCELNGGKIGGRRAATVEDSFVKITFKHAFAAASNVLPVTEDWEYRFELHHRGTHQALATWSANISLKINRPDEIGKAKLKVTATGMSEPLLVPFEKK